MTIQVGNLLKFILSFASTIEKKEINNIHWSLILFIKNKYIYLSPISSSYWNISENLNNILSKKTFIFYQKSLKDNGEKYSVTCWKNIQVKNKLKNNILKITIKKDYPLVFSWNDSYLFFKNIIKIKKEKFLEKLIYKKKFIKKPNEFKKNFKEYFENKLDFKIISSIKIIYINLEYCKSLLYKKCPECKSNLEVKNSKYSEFIWCKKYHECGYKNKIPKDISAKISFWKEKFKEKIKKEKVINELLNDNDLVKKKEIIKVLNDIEHTYFNVDGTLKYNLSKEKLEEIKNWLIVLEIKK